MANPIHTQTQLLQKAQLIDIILSPLSNEHPWQDIEVITLKQTAIDKATDYVLSHVEIISNVPALIRDQLNTAEAKICREYINIDTDKITIGLHQDAIDDRSVDIALSKILSLGTLTPGIHYFGPEHILDFSRSPSESIV